MTGTGHPRSHRAPSRAAWCSRAEEHSLATSTALLREARANTRRVVTNPGFLAALAREVALARGPELTLAYRNLVSMMPGFRKKQGARGTRVTSELCVVFVVRRKTGIASEHPQHLPRWLITFAEHEGVRKPFALPTDVQDAGGFCGARAHSASAVWVKNGDWPPASGSFTCLVMLRHPGGQQTCMLSAQHVLTPFADGDALQVTSGLAVLPLDDSGARASAPGLADSLPFGGVLRGDERPDRPSFDVQLAALDGDGSAVRQRVGLRRLNAGQPWVRSMNDLLLLDREGWFHLLTPDNHATNPGRGALRMALSAMPSLPVPIPYRFAGEPQAQDKTVYHVELLRFDAVDSKLPVTGDSGSPIIVRRDDGSMTLVAMHIGGDGLGLSWAIPAWRLFDLANWSQYPTGAQVTPVDA
jgi:hypothetical protein